MDLPFGKSIGVRLTKQSEAVRINPNQKEGYRIMPKTITLRLSDEDFHLFQAFAKAENRTLANAIETLALKQIEEELFADDFEMEEIRNNKNLLERLKAGSEQAKRMKGRFVE
jgi:hypothetical protein